MSGFFYTLNGIGLVSRNGVWNGTLAQMLPKALDWCAQSGAHDTKYAVGYCFGAAYMYTLLVDGYGFDPATAGLVTSSRKLNGVKLGWAMGAALHQISDLGCDVALENDKELIARLAECQASRSRGSELLETHSSTKRYESTYEGPFFKTTRPTFFMHGIMASETTGNLLENNLKGADVYWESLDVANDKQSMERIPDQADLVKAKIKKHCSNHRCPDGVNLICHSQGGLTCRYLITTWHDHPVKTFISLASPQMGVEGYGSWLAQFPGPLKHILHVGMYNEVAQKMLSVANYWHVRDTPAGEREYRRWTVLARINNEAPAESCRASGLFSCTPKTNGCKKKSLLEKCSYPGDKTGFNKNPQFTANFKKLDHAIFMGSPDDEAIVPTVSTVFGYYKKGCGHNSRNCKDTEHWDQSYIKDLLPLQEMKKAGKFETYYIPDMKHNHWIRDEGVEQAQRHYAKYL